MLPINAFPLWLPGQPQREKMTSGTKHLEVTLETQVESVNLAEEMCLRVAEAAGFGEDDCYRIGMSVREGVINAFHYGNQERPEKKIYLAVDITSEKLIIHVLDEGRGFTLADVPDPLAEENLLEPCGCRLHRQLRNRRTRQRVHRGEESRRRIEAAPADKESTRPSSNHKTLYSVRYLYRRERGHSQFLMALRVLT